MGLFKMNWLRRFVRRNTNPIEENQAVIWKQRLSIGYAILAWNAFGFVCYMIYTGRNDWAKYYGVKSEEEQNTSPGKFYASKLNLNKGKIIRFDGFSRVSEESFDNTTKTE